MLNVRKIYSAGFVYSFTPCSVYPATQPVSGGRFGYCICVCIVEFVVVLLHCSCNVCIIVLADYGTILGNLCQSVMCVACNTHH